MRIDVFKLVFIGLEKDQRSFFQRAQEAGLIEFIRKDRSRHSDVPEPILKLNHALKILGSLPPTEQEESLPSYSTEHLVNQVLHFQEERESALEEIKLLHLEMDRVEIFGSFQLEDIAFIENHSNYRVRFFQAKEDDAIDEDPALILIGRDAFLRYYISIDQDFQPKAPLIEMQVDRPWNALQSALEGAKLRLAKAERELHSLEKWKKFLSHALLAKLDSFHLESAAQSGQLALENRLFSVEGWAPKNKLEDLHRLAQASDVYLEEVGLEEGERIPTYLENHGAAQVGQDLVEIYDTPSNKDKDPSLWVFGGFLLFFSMIVGDAGYGLVYLLLTLYLGCKFKPSTPKGIRFFKLATLLSVSTILMGLFSNSILAIPISLDNPLMSIS
ncbi:MAG: ntpI, partial [Chlamydiales bacterium]|nr:ntpI [Chlamydiales bacterium]